MSGQPSTSTSGQDTRDEDWKKVFERLNRKPLPKKTEERETFIECFEKSAPPLEYEAIMKEMDMKRRKLEMADVVEEFKTLRKRLQAQMLKSPYIRRALVGSLYDTCGGKGNETMQATKDLTDKRNPPVAMNEIEYCIRRFKANEEIDVDTHIDVLLKHEKVMRPLKFFEWLINLQPHSNLLLPEETKIDFIDILINPRHIDVSFIEVKIAATCYSELYKSYKNPHDTNNVLHALAAALKLFLKCKECKATITKLKLTIGGTEVSKSFLRVLMKAPRLLELKFGTFELQNSKAKISYSLELCNNIQCTNLNITDGTFEEDNAETIFEAMKSCQKAVQKWSFTSTEMIPNEIIAKGLASVDPYFEVTVGYDKELRQHCIVLKKTDKPGDGNPKQCKWGSIINL